MARREDLGSWLEGTPAGEGPDGGSGRGRLRLPTSGPGSRATVGRRLGALAIDWVLSMLVSGAFFPEPGAVVPRVLAGDPLATLLVFGVSTLVLVMTLGHTVGHRVLGLQVVRVRDLPGADPQDPRSFAPPSAWPPPGPVAAALRTALLCLVIPPAIWDGDGRGMHDAAAGTVIVRR